MVKGTKLVAYYRVSTKRQGASGLGLAAQREAVRKFAEQHGAKIIAEHTETESGKLTTRPELIKAIARAKRSKATLIVAKLDRLARNAGFLLTLQGSGLPLAFCDYPNANELTVGIMAVVAEDERRAISKRTKEALAQAKKRGVRLGSQRSGHWEDREEERRKGGLKGSKIAAKLHHERAMEAYIDIAPLIAELRDEGLSLQKIADRLNDDGHRTRRDKPWNAVQVSRVLKQGV